MPKIALKEKINTINFGYIINSIGKIVKIGKLALKLFEIFLIDFSCFFSFVLVYPTPSNDKDEFVRN